LKTRASHYLNTTLIGILLGFICSACCLYPSNAFAISTEEEKILGQKFLSQLRSQFELVDDNFATQYINDLGHYLITPLETQSFRFRFYIVKDNTLNAFAAPGGNIFLFSGLIQTMDSVDELSAVICHEIGHVAARHLAQRIEQNKKIGLATMAGILAGAFVGGPAGEALITGSVAAGVQTQLHYSRNDERQADQLGFKYMKAAGFDPSGMLTVLKKIEKGHWANPDAVPTYLLTHPTGPERLSSLDTLLSTYTQKMPKREAEKFTTLFPYFKTIIRAKCLDSHDAEMLFKVDLKKDSGSTLPNFGLGILYRERSDYALAINYLKKALRHRPGSMIILRNLGEAYQMNGQDHKAIAVLEKALKRDENDKSALFLLGMSYENLEEYKKAISLFERLASFRPVKNEVYYHLGLSYGRQNRLALAHYNFGIYFKRMGRPQQASFHFQKALKLSENDPHLNKRIRKASKEPL